MYSFWVLWYLCNLAVPFYPPSWLHAWVWCPSIDVSVSCCRTVSSLVISSPSRVLESTCPGFMLVSCISFSTISLYSCLSHFPHPFGTFGMVFLVCCFPLLCLFLQLFVNSGILAVYCCVVWCIQWVCSVYVCAECELLSSSSLCWNVKDVIYLWVVYSIVMVKSGCGNMYVVFCNELFQFFRRVGFQVVDWVRRWSPLLVRCVWVFIFG